MGMAASQARYLALVARKSNCEYEGQQINQARLNLSNQSANLFNQMLGLKVPVPPSVNDFTKYQYSFTDGVNNAVIDNWYQLAEPDSDGFNYVIDYHYNANVYTGSQKLLNDPQVQFTRSSTDISPDYTSQVIDIEAALTRINVAQSEYDSALDAYNTIYKSSKTLSTYKDSGTYTHVSSYTVDETTGAYTVTYGAKTEEIDGKTYYTYTGSDGKIYYSANGSDFGIKNSAGQYESVTITMAPQETHEEGDEQEFKIGDETYKAYTATVGGSPTTVYSIDGTTFFTLSDTGALSSVTPTGTPTIKIYTDAGNNTLTIGSNTYNVCEAGDGTNYYENGGKYYVLDGTSITEITDKTILKSLTQNNFQETFKKYTSGSSPDIDNAIEVLCAADTTITVNDFYYDSNGNLVLQRDLSSLVDGQGHGTNTVLPLYHVSGTAGEGETWKSVAEVQTELNVANFTMLSAKAELDNAKAAYEIMNVPEYVGNNKLVPLVELEPTQISEIKQIIKDMTDLDVVTNLSKYYNPNTDEYLGGIYSFTLNGINYYTTYDDLANSILGGDGINNIDDQPKLPYYRADYISTKISKQEKAVLETDSQGRFTSVRIGDDTVKYTLNVETITDDAAYEDAMNKYYYENAKYDKMVQDINAKTSVIQAEDRTLELRLKQLDTEQNALSNEMEAVQKVVKENVEKSFKTFGG